MATLRELQVDGRLSNPKLAEKLSCHNGTGDCDYMLQIVASDLDVYGVFVIDKLRKLPGVTSIRSNLSLGELKFSNVGSNGAS